MLTPRHKKILSILAASSTALYVFSILFFEVDNPSELYEYLIHLNHRRNVKRDLGILKRNSPSSSGLKFLSSTSPTIPNKKELLIERIKDHTVKISRWCRKDNNILYRFGTGWFLDHVLTDDGSYPLKWFLATNAHVIDEHTFHSNPYKQILPVDGFIRFLRSNCSYYGITLYRWESGGWDEKMFLDLSLNPQEPLNWSHPDIKKIFEDNRESFTYAKNLNFSDKRWNKYHDIPLMGLWIEDPKLFYSPRNFLSNIKYSHFKDFAVLEIDFPNERSARRLTEKIYKSENRINFLSEVTSDKSEFFIAGYPGNSYNHFKTFGNYSHSLDRASKMDGCHPIFQMNLKEMDPPWSHSLYLRSGCYYKLLDNNLGEGSSGSMVVDLEGNLLGLHTIGDENNIHSFAEPIRMKKNCQLSGYLCANDEEYDLISGGFPNQITSYKDQVKAYGLKTYLGKLGNW